MHIVLNKSWLDFLTTSINADVTRAAFLEQCKEQAIAAGLKGPQAELRSMVPRLIRAGRQALCLQSYYTAGPKEVRAWTIMKGTLAPQAAGVIHTDFERGFIKAEVCNIEDFKVLHKGECSMAKCKEAGKYRQEGKMYAMQEGDIGTYYSLMASVTPFTMESLTSTSCCFSRLHAQHNNRQKEVMP